MADIAAAAPVGASIRWRTIGLAVLIIAILVAALAIVAGTQRPKVPAPFGPARNGLIVYPTGGDIYALDPRTGETTALVKGDSNDLDPLFSPDGTRLAFDRLSSGQNVVSTNVMVTDTTGAHPVAVTPHPIAADGERFEWAADSRSIYVQTAEHEIWLLDATTPGQPRVLATNAELVRSAARPPDGRQLLIRQTQGSWHQLVVLDPATGDKRVIAEGGEDFLQSARWSTSGRQVAYTAPGTGDLTGVRLWIVDADGTNRHQVTNAPGTWADLDLAWSPDDRFIAFNRYQRTSTNPDVWDVRPIGLLDVATGSVTSVGPLPRDVRGANPTEHDSNARRGEGFGFEWSPDGRTILAVPSEATGHAIVIDPFANTWKVVGPLFDEQGGASQEWQRQLP